MIKNLRSLKKKQQEIRVTEHYDFLVVGCDTFAIQMAYWLLTSKQDKKTALITSRPLQARDYFFSGPELVRGEENIKALHALLPQLDVSERMRKPSFYKDQKFRSFGGKIPPHKLLENEAFFAQNAVEIKIKDLEWKSQVEINEVLEGHVHYRHLKKMGQNKNEAGFGWGLECEDGSLLSCEHLILADSPYAVGQIFQHGETISSGLNQFFHQNKPPYSLIITFKSDRQISDRQGTILLPQSQKYDHGHFIGRFEMVNQLENTQEYSFLCYLPEEETTAANMTAKVKLLKRILGRTFSDFSKAKTSCHYQISEGLAGDDFKAENFESLTSNLNNIYFISQLAPLKNSFVEQLNLTEEPLNISHLTRQLFSFEQTKSELQN